LRGAQADNFMLCCFCWTISCRPYIVIHILIPAGASKGSSSTELPFVQFQETIYLKGWFLSVSCI
jgi:hypothetical protein